MKRVTEWSCHCDFQHALKFLTWFFNMPWNFQHGFQHILKFLTWFSAHLEIFNMDFNTVFNMVHNIGEFQNSTFDIFYTFNEKSSLTFILCSY